MEILCDTREVRSGIPSALSKQAVSTQTQPLVCGDYQCGDMVISRKTISDFIKSVNSGHLEKELGKCIEARQKAQFELWLLIEDDGWGKETVWADLFAKGAGADQMSCGRFNGLVATLQRKGIGLLFSPGKSYTPLILERECRRKIEPEGRFLNRYVKETKVYNVPVQVATLLDLWPRLPEAVARRLIKKYNSAWAVLNQTEQELMSVGGLGSGLIENLNRRLGRSGTDEKNNKVSRKGIRRSGTH